MATFGRDNTRSVYTVRCADNSTITEDMKKQANQWINGVRVERRHGAMVVVYKNGGTSPADEAARKLWAKVLNQERTIKQLRRTIDDMQRVSSLMS